MRVFEADNVTVVCDNYSTKSAWGHTAHIAETDIKEKIRYYNRTWESFQYETILFCILEKAVKQGKISQETYQIFREKFVR